MSVNHVCQCTACAPDAYPNGPRQGSGHIAVRFGTGFERGRPYWEAALDGELVHDLIEALPGQNGYVIVNGLDESGKAHLCRTCAPPGLPLFRGQPGVNPDADACRLIRYGHVVTWQMPPEAWTPDRRLRAERARELMPKGAS